MNNIPTHTIKNFQEILQTDGQKKDYFFLDKIKYSSLPKEPYRTETYGIGLFKKGKVQLNTGVINYIVETPSIITMGTSVIRSWKQLDDRPDSSTLFFTEDYFIKSQANIHFLRQFSFFENNDCHVLPLEKETLQRYEIIFNLVKDVIASNHLHEAEIIRSLIYILLHEIDAGHKSVKKENHYTPYPVTVLNEKFKTILAKEFIRHRSVSYYAAQLHLTPKHFSEKIKDETGKTASEWINEMVVLEAKVLLQNHEQSIVQISDVLNFPSQSVFGKFFKTHTGLSPLEYRKTII